MAFKISQVFEASEDCILSESAVEVEKMLTKSVEQACKLVWLYIIYIKMIFDEMLDDEHVISYISRAGL